MQMRDFMNSEITRLVISMIHMRELENVDEGIAE